MVEDLNLNKPKVSSLTTSTPSWDASSTCTLKSGANVLLPWATTSGLSNSSIPDDVRLDIKEGDGWKILLSTVSIDGYATTITPADKGII